ncbi:hypothetical protein [Dysgonomonas macrotermitis]|uniref:hypothetical protein n=1 Tax=Dysgonomonas macrotermitis TaxID=1346286 RepID=UPI000782EA8F|nr:hypothetical protein [Dysgonomonas macrotermitis]
MRGKRKSTLIAKVFTTNPESYRYLVLDKKEVDRVLSKRKEDNSYKQSFELVREYDMQKPIVYVYKIKLKDLDVGEGFHSEEINYVCCRVII